MNWIRESELALQAVAAGIELIEDAYPGGLVVAAKGNPRDLVTQFDVAIEKQVGPILAASGHPVFGEEADGGSLPPSVPYWAVDPIDGTANFASSIPIYGISAGLVDGDVFRVGAVSLPSLKEIYFTLGGDAAYRNGKRLAVREAPLDVSLLAASFSARGGDKARRSAEFAVFGELNDASRGCLRLGSASLNVCYVASGRLQCAYGIGAKVWDVAGALAVARLAGARIFVDPAKGGRELGYVVGSPGVAEAVVEALAARGLGSFKAMP